jgi:methionyl-tRNA formyltransferase
MRILLLGTKDFAVPSFSALFMERRGEILALVSQPEKPQGRKQEIVEARVTTIARGFGVPVLMPEDVNALESVEALRAFGPDLLVTAAYGQILSAELLAIARYGGINLHGSILPKYRGAAPVARAIQAGEQETGVTVIQMSPRMDAGGILSVARTEIGPDETAGELESRLAVLGAPLVLEAVAAIESGQVRVVPQEGTMATRAPKLRKEEAPIDWELSARRIHDHVRALRPWPVAETRWVSADDKRSPLRILVHGTSLVATTDSHGTPGTVMDFSPSSDKKRSEQLVVSAGVGTVALDSIQVPGKRILTAAEFLRGYPLVPGDRFER